MAGETGQTLKRLVNSIIDERISSGQLDESDRPDASDIAVSGRRLSLHSRAFTIRVSIIRPGGKTSLAMIEQHICLKLTYRLTPPFDTLVDAG